MKTLLAVAGVLSIATTTPAFAQTDVNTVQGLYQLCNGDAASYGICFGYVSGVGDMMSLVGFGGLDPAISICGVQTHAAMTQAFKNWAAQHPEELSLDAPVGVAKALRERWPCPKK